MPVGADFTLVSDGENISAGSKVMVFRKLLWRREKRSFKRLNVRIGIRVLQDGHSFFLSRLFQGAGCRTGMSNLLMCGKKRHCNFELVHV